MKTFNLNDKVLVDITEYGWEEAEKNVGKDYIEHCILPYKIVVKGINYYKIQAHQIISIWGKSVWYSFPSPISSNILIPD